MRLFLPLGLVLLLLSGCGFGPAAPATQVQPGAIQGKVHGGQQAVVGAHVYLYAANTAGYNISAATYSSVSLLTSSVLTNEPNNSGVDGSGNYYVTTDVTGSFNISNDYSCTPDANGVPGQQVYLYAVGGNPGSGTNPAASFMAILGDCPAIGNFSIATPYVWMNEVSTVAAAYAMAGFAYDSTHVSSSGTNLAKVGIENAFANAANLVTLSTGNPLTTTPSGNGTVPQSLIITLANMLAACVNSTGIVTGPPLTPNATPCYTLFTNAESEGVTGLIDPPTDTATAMINIAHNPGRNVTALYDLQTGMPAFGLGLTTAPNDFSIGLNFNTFNFYANTNIAVDGNGNVWHTNSLYDVTVLSSSGYQLSGASGYTDGLYGPRDLAIDLSGNVWIGNYAAVIPSSSNPYSLFEISNEGGLLSGAGYTGGGLYDEGDMAIDGTGNVWAVNDSSVSKFSPSGVALSGAGFTGGGMHVPIGIAIDGTGNAWVGNLGSNIIKLSSSGIILSGSNGFTDGGTGNPYGVAIDSSGNVWAAYPSGATGTTGRIVKFSNAGAVLSGSTGFTANGTINPYYIAIDGAGNVWAPNSQGNSVAELSNSGAVLSGSVGYTGGILGDPFWIAVDGSGDVWVTNASFTTTAYQVTELIGIATPVITPICAGLPATPTADGSSKLGTRP